MNKIWSLLFFAVPVFGVGAFVIAPMINHWLPRDVSEHGYAIDHLFMFILWLTGGVFIVTEVALAYFLWRFDGRSNPDPVKFMHGSHSLEIVWTILPAATLLFIAIYQMNAWADTKMRKPPIPPTIEVTARQFEWRLRYPGGDGMIGTPDDLFYVNDMHVPVNEDILVELKSQDVLHSFFLPNLRVKQDAVPGMKIPVWFKPKEIGVYDIVCAELCGWGHYKMKGRLTVETREQYEAWLANLEKEQMATTESKSKQPTDDEDE